MPTLANDNPPDGMTQPLLEQIFQLWLRPELEARGLDQQPEEVIRALVIFTPRRKPKVLIDAEAEMVVRGRTTRPIEAGERVTEADLEAVEGLVPRDIDPDAGCGSASSCSRTSTRSRSTSAATRPGPRGGSSAPASSWPQRGSPWTTT